MTTAIQKGNLSLLFMITSVGVLATVPLSVEQIRMLCATPFMHFFALAWLAYLVCIWRSPKVGIASGLIRRYAGVSLIASGLVLSLFATLAWSPNLGQVAIILMLTGWSLLRLGVVPWTRVIAFTSFLWITWPLPGNINAKILSRMRHSAFQTASNILDFFEVPHFLSGSLLDLKAARIDLTAIQPAYDNLFSLLFVALLFIVGLQNPFLISCLVLFLVPLIAWLGTIAHVLLHSWVHEAFATHWLEGWWLVGIQMGFFVAECGLVWCLFAGVHRLFEPLFSDSPDQTNRNIQNWYNRLILWPLRLVEHAGAEARAYFEEDLHEGKSDESRRSPVRVNFPSVTAAKAASDPWIWNRWTISLFSLAGLTFVLGVATRLVPQPALKPLPNYSTESLNRFAKSVEFPETLNQKLLGHREPAHLEDSEINEVVWEFNYDRGGLVFAVSLPQRYVRTFATTKNWQLSKTSLVEESEWHVVESEFVNEFGRSAYVWTTAFNEDSKPAAFKDTLFKKILGRLNGSFLGKTLISRDDKSIFQTTMILESNTALAERGKKLHRTAIIEFTKAIMPQTIGLKP
jgi:hypothetical protein